MEAETGASPHVALSRHPAVFSANAKPLALGVGKLIWPRAKATGINRPAFNAAMKYHTTSIRYLEALAAMERNAAISPRRSKRSLGSELAQRTSAPGHHARSTAWPEIERRLGVKS